MAFLLVEQTARYVADPAPGLDPIIIGKSLRYATNFR
ncbi:MAG: hypothetical protein JWM33_2150 [Caulobacteraceae bacterium]|nr:hypothetical protein [Caulobacteraceae bacterium]